MTISAKIICDSIWDSRITTLELRYPRFIHAEFMTHRMFSRNASSSRAIPVERLIQDVLEDPAMPIHWGKNQKGMQARQENDELVVFRNDAVPPDIAWLRARDVAVDAARRFSKAGYHKQIVNRLLEPFSHINVVVTATEWTNFFALRRHPDAQPEIHELADRMLEAMDGSTPSHREYHLPYTTWEDGPGGFEVLEKISAARCARVSYRTHDGRFSTPEEDLALAEQLRANGHLSPFEHAANAADGWHANFFGWKSTR